MKYSYTTHGSEHVGYRFIITAYDSQWRKINERHSYLIYETQELAENVAEELIEDKADKD